MDLATVFSIVQTILTLIQLLEQLRSKFSSSQGKTKIGDLEKTVRSLKSILMDAEAKQGALSHQETSYVLSIKDALYEANDVLDEFLTLMKRNILIQDNHKHTGKVRSSLLHLKTCTSGIYKKVDEVKVKLDAVLSQNNSFTYKVEDNPGRVINRETDSFISASEIIIGRGKDVETIIKTLLASNDKMDILSLAIVGMGGLGKTALAKLVYNDPRVATAFQLKSWICIADHDPKHWNLTELLDKVLKELSGGNNHNLTSLEQIQYEVRRHLEGKKYLLVFDDVWTENYNEWVEFKKYFKVGQNGSRIIITTRSRNTAKMVGGYRVHELRSLSRKESWCLFKRMAFRAEQIENPDYDLVRVGQNIAKKCADVPLAIRVVACLLRGQPKNKWLSFQDKVLASIDESDDISRILNLSYHRLEPPIKSCFAYCAIFPKDMEIDKQMLISLWLAQGYISSYDMGDEYFETLLQRCFFQDLVKDKWGEYRWFKIHDLMHAIAERAAGGEICRLSFKAANTESDIRHLSLLSGFYTKEMFYKTQTRSCLQVNQPCTDDLVQTSNLIGNWASLRSLDLQRLVANRLTAPLGKLIHLRYLNLSGSEALEILPDSITDLLNLQTLDLSGCTSLHKLPENMCDLADLSTLNLDSCYNLSHMPTRIGILTGLHTLGLFVVGQGSSNGKHCFDGLEDLYSLNNLKGQLEIRIGVRKNAKNMRYGGGTYLRGKKFLKRVAIKFRKGKNYGSVENEQMLLEEMQPHDDVLELDLEGYHGKTMPRWPSREDNSAVFHLPYLVTLVISQCDELQYLPFQAGTLPRLKKLELYVLPKMEYLVNVSPEVSGMGEGISFFPCLKEVYISKLPMLKGWWPSTGSEVQNQYIRREKTPCFAQLKKVEIIECPMLTYMPVCSCPDSLRVYDFGRLLKCVSMSHIPHQHQTLSRLNPKPKILTIHHLEWLKLMPTRCIERVAVIEVNDDKVESLGQVRELLDTLSSLQFVKFRRCLKLRNEGGWLTQLSTLHSLSIDDCPNHLVEGIPWKNLPKSLKCLSLIGLEEMEKLPEGMQYCTSLSSLIIQYCPKLQSIPNWMPQLTSLQILKLHCSKTLKRRCQNPYGKDRLLIQHIPTISIKEIQGKGNDETWIKQEWWH